MKKALIFCSVLIAVTAPVAAQTAMTTPIADARPGTSVTLQGVVDRITDDDEFHLRDATGWIEIYVGPNRVPVVVGEQITVEGLVDDEPGPREVYARILTRADGTVITFDHRDD